MQPHLASIRRRLLLAAHPAPLTIVAAVVTAALVACSGDGPTGTRPQPSIDLALTSGTVWVAPGQAASVDIGLTRRGGYTGAVSLAVTGAPAGVTASFDPPAIASATTGSTLTLAAAPTAVVGTYTLAITGTGGGVADHVDSLTLIVTTGPIPAIGVSAATATLSLSQGQTDMVVIYLSRSGDYSGPIGLAVTGAPGGVQVALAPASVTWEGFSILTLEAGARVPPGTYSLTVTATGRDVQRQSAALTLTISTPPSAWIGVSFLGTGELGTGDFAWTVQGDSWTWPGITVTRSPGYTGVVTLTIEGLPSGVTARFDPPSLDAGTKTSSVTFTATADAPPVTVPVTIRAKGEGVADATTVFRFVVFPPASG